VAPVGAWSVQKGLWQSAQQHSARVRDQVSIPLGLLNGFVTKDFPHGEEVYTIHDRMASEGMPERMEGNPIPPNAVSRIRGTKVWVSRPRFYPGNHSRNGEIISIF